MYNLLSLAIDLFPINLTRPANSISKIPQNIYIIPNPLTNKRGTQMVSEKTNILKTLQKTLEALKTKNYLKIKLLSDQIIHQASIEQDPDIISLAVIIYSLSKLVERESYKTEKNWPEFYKSFMKNLDDMIESLEEDDLERFRDEINQNRRLIQNLSGNLKHFIQDVFRKAQINKASKIYEHGISMETTAKILGISIWELAEYSGSKVKSDGFTSTMPIKQRVQMAQEIFG